MGWEGYYAGGYPTPSNGAGLPGSGAVSTYDRASEYCFWPPFKKIEINGNQSTDPGSGRQR